jgi:hypothetical protein
VEKIAASSLDAIRDINVVVPELVPAYGRRAIASSRWWMTGE